jgi:transcription antitermination factor NusA-like protein
MRAPLCEVCLSSEILCQGCAGKLERGELTQTEVDVSRFMWNMGEKLHSLREATVKKVIDSDVMLIVAGKGDGAKVVGKGGAVVKALAKQYGKSIRVLEENEFKPFISELLHPLPVTGVNTLFTPDGEVQRVRLPAAQKPRSMITPAGFSTMMQQLYGRKVELLFED